MIRLRFFGTRGSIPTPGPTTLRYGGNTACVELRGAGDELVVFDAGTGLRELGLALKRENGSAPLDVHLLLSHLHWDHIQGLPFFVPAYEPQNLLTIYGPAEGGEEQSLPELLGLGMRDPFFPVTLDALRALLSVRQLDGGAFEVGRYRVRTAPLWHPAPCVGYRVDVEGRSVVYVTDSEDPFSGRENPVPGLARDADVLIHDAQYLPEDFRPGWGHSTVEAAVDVAAAAGVRHLVLFHHDPMRDDDALDAVGERARGLIAGKGAAMKLTVAREGLEITL